jgi:hypothetical protein
MPPAPRTVAPAGTPCATRQPPREREERALSKPVTGGVGSRATLTQRLDFGAPVVPAPMRNRAEVGNPRLTIHTRGRTSIASRRLSPAPNFDFDIMTSITEITVVSGERCRVEGEARDVERRILDAARGSIMQFAWLTDAATGEPVGINPDCVVILRAVGPSQSAD